MAFNCGPEIPQLAESEHHAPPANLERQHSAFGDAYSVRSRSTGSVGRDHHYNDYGHYNDDPEADYDQGATPLYRMIENKDWDGALSRLEIAPIESKTWVFRREYGGSKIRWRLLPIHAVCIFRAPLALIEALIEVYNDGPQMKDDQGMLPVHLACRNGASKGVVLTLLNSFPGALHVRDRKGRSPMDLVLASNSANRETVLVAMKRFQRDVGPMAMPPENHFGPGRPTVRSHSPERQRSRSRSRTPSRSSSRPTTPTRGVSPSTPSRSAGTQTRASASVAAASNAVSTASNKSGSGIAGPVVSEVDYENRTVLFRLLLKKDWKAAAARAKQYPDECATWIVTKGFNGNLRFLPIHKACVLQPPVAIIDALLTSYEDGAAAKDQDGWLPIHCAAFYGSDESVINAILKANSKGAQTKDDEGRMPLHYACLKGASVGVVDVLLATYAKAAVSKDTEGRLPIHHACSKGAPEGVIEALLKASPKGAQSKDDQGRLPLHHACRKNASERTIRTLLRVYPRAAQIKDDQDKLPIHYACQNAANVSVVTLLLATYPESVNVANGFGATPLMEAKNHEKSQNTDQVIRALEKVKKEQDKMKQSSNTEPNVMEEKVTVLHDKVKELERTLSKVARLGEGLKDELSKSKDPTGVLENFADELVHLGRSGGRSNSASSRDKQHGGGSSSGGRKSPLRARQQAAPPSRQQTQTAAPSPLKNFFGRHRNRSSGGNGNK